MLKSLLSSKSVLDWVMLCTSSLTAAQLLAAQPLVAEKGGDENTTSTVTNVMLWLELILATEVAGTTCRRINSPA
ncbi:MAG: hypothetical protein ACI9ON_001518 [Limisphaerales bacterium]|jgi:hypothetical protein